MEENMNNKRPNILVIFSDQLRRDALSVYGDENISTPHMDKLAREGCCFENASSTYPICVPFRFTLITGEYAHSRMVPGIQWRMSPAERTLADEFNEAGYETVYVGKWHLYGGHGRMPHYDGGKGVNRVRVPAEYQGRWQHWYGFELRNGFYDTVYFKDDDPTPIPIKTYQTDGLFDICMEHLSKRQNDKPFLNILSVEAPHPPREAPEELLHKWLNKDISLPPNFEFADPEKRQEWIKNRQIYYAMVENLDCNVGRLMDFLEKSELKDNTIVMLFSDHGDMCGCHNLFQKQYPYEESVGIPLIINDPTGDFSPRQSSFPTCTEDLFPTITGLAGITPKNKLHGKDLTPIVRGDCDDLDREAVLLEFVDETRPGVSFFDKVWRGVRSKRYKYTVIGDYSGAEPWQFFDLQEDPYEMNNLLEDPGSSDEIKRHHKMLMDLLISTGDHFALKGAFGYEHLNVCQ